MLDSKEYIIFSVEKSDLTKEKNKGRTNKVIQILETFDIPYKKGIGSFGNKLEVSFAVESQDLIDRDLTSFLHHLIFDRFGQDAKLICRRDNSCQMEWNETGLQYVGYLSEREISDVLDSDQDFSIFGNKAYVLN